MDAKYNHFTSQWLALPIIPLTTIITFVKFEEAYPE